MTPAMLFALAADSMPITVPKRDVVMEFATCVRRRAPDRAEALLRSEPGSHDEHHKVRVIAAAYNACIKDRSVLSFPLGMLRGQLAELEFRENAALRDRAATLAASPAARPDTAAVERESRRAPASLRDQVYAENFRAAYARCVADADPRQTAALLPTAADSAEERQAVVGYGDALMRCMPAGVTYHIIPAELRPYLVAQLYYRAAGVAPQDAENHGRNL